MRAKTTITWLMRVLVLVALGLAIWVTRYYTDQLKEQMADLLYQQEAIPLQQLQSQVQRTTLDRRSFDIGRISELVINRDEVIDVAATIEEEGQLLGVDVSIPTIDVVEERSEEGEKRDSSGAASLIKARIQVSAEGDPYALLALMHRVEHLPYLMEMESWNLRMRQVVPPPGEDVILDEFIGSVRFDVILVVQQEEGVS